MLGLSSRLREEWMCAIQKRTLIMPRQEMEFFADYLVAELSVSIFKVMNVCF
jgi:hypothetical protein